MSDYRTSIIRLSVIAEQIAKVHMADLLILKSRQHDLEREDFIWYYLLLSFSSMGGSRGATGFDGTYVNLAYDKLKLMPSDNRIATIDWALAKAKVRWPNKKALWVSECLDRIEAMGGLVAAKAKLLSSPGREEKIRFLSGFTGIGPKYARNIMMDVYQEDFRDSIALDSRVRKVTALLGLSFSTYAEEEAFFRDAAHHANLEGWELDRLIYNYIQDFVLGLSSQALSKGTGQ